MPRRNYRSGRGRSRPMQPSGVALGHLAAELTRRQTPAKAAPCVVCGLTLPPGWQYPEHARCLNTRPERNPR